MIVIPKNKDLQGTVTIKGDSNPYVGDYTTQDDVMKSTTYSYFQYRSGQKYYGTVNSQGVWQPFPHFTVTGDRRSPLPFSNQDFRFFHITLPAKDGSSQGLRIFYDGGNFTSIDIASLPAQEKVVLQQAYDANKGLLDAIAVQFWYAAQGLPVAVPQAKGGYQISLKSKDLPAVVNYPSTATVEKK